jgi:hypothetical protein
MGTVWLLDQCAPQYGELLMRIDITFISYSLKMTNLVYLVIEALSNSSMGFINHLEVSQKSNCPA